MLKSELLEVIANGESSGVEFKRNVRYYFSETKILNLA